MQPENPPVSNGSYRSLPLYSPLAVRVFALVFGPLFGAVLAYQNLKDLGRPKPARWLLLSCAYTVVVLFIANSLIGKAPIGTYVVVATGFWLGNRYEQLVPKAGQYSRKSIVKPLCISLIVSFVILLLTNRRLLSMFF